MRQAGHINRGLVTMMGALTLASTWSLLPANGQEDARPGPAGISREIAEALLDHAKARLPAGPPDPEIVSVDAVTWNDTALGCPQPDEVPSTRRIAGYRVSVQAGDVVMQYHVAQDGSFRRCSIRMRAPAPIDHPYPGPRLPPRDAEER